jgi:hypothetical protein
MTGLRRALMCSAAMIFAYSAYAQGVDAVMEYRVLATSKTSTMEKELNDTAGQGYRFSQVMGGDTAAGGRELVVVMSREKRAASKGPRIYKVLATNKTSTMQKELQGLADEGYEYLGQTVYASAIGGQEVVVIMERDPARKTTPVSYRLLATNKTSTMEKELGEAGSEGYRLLGMTVAKTAFGGAELVSILRK